MLKEELSSGLAMVAGIILLALVSVIGYQYVDIQHLNALLSSERAARAQDSDRATQAALKATQDNLAKTELINQANQKASDEYQTKIADRDKTIAALRSDSVRLKADIARYTAASRQARTDSSPSQCLDDPRVSTLGALLAEGISLQDDGEEAVRGLAAQVEGLQSFVRNVCLAH